VEEEGGQLPPRGVHISPILLENCVLLDGALPEVQEGMHVLVEGEGIRDISHRPITAPDAYVINCQGKTLMPGLIDAHVHLIATIHGVSFPS
jgi:imidazolonepropionase-like amidohydrolase